MTIRQMLEAKEKSTLNKYACLSSETLGREQEENLCDIRTNFQMDRDRILHSKSFRRLKHKTQVFISPESDHFRTRLTHTLEVAQIARTMAKALELNEDLTEAIALGHDLGHTPFGHAGEDALNSVTPFGFAHNLQSIRVVCKLEGDNGLNLSKEVLDGIKNHTGPISPFTLEGQLVKLADRIAYINHDIEDAITANIISADDLPFKSLKVLGCSKSDRIDTLVKDIIICSKEQQQISQTPVVKESMDELREFLFDSVYLNSPAKTQEYKAKNMIIQLYHLFLQNPQKMESKDHADANELGDVERKVCDYIAGMTDRYIVSTYKQHFIPRGWSRNL
ncbi:deoxyguanosinetriphosphate triphosphohydrolase [Proteinivorax hydrogeniformans]|uniref:Deoxyguanosinetriphosphate triphosphohydrolase-like protein n=1 Tax=Proteinivorax hydrogeniformans TaxID=1826727 RepID=A0AAU8HX98_9FIRM